MSDFAANAPGFGLSTVFSALFGSSAEEVLADELGADTRRALMNDLLSRCPTAVTSEAGMHELMSVYPEAF